MRLREKVSPSLRAALENLEANAETLPDVDSPHFLPRWDFSQTHDKVTIVLYTKNPDPTFSYCEELANGGFVIMACFGWYKRIVSLVIPDFYEDVLTETGLMNMTPSKIEISFKKARSSEITWPRVHQNETPTMKQEGIMNPVPPRPAETIVKDDKSKKTTGPKSKEQQLLDQLRKARIGDDDENDEGKEAEVTDPSKPRTFTAADVLPAENVAHGRTNELEALPDMRTGGLYDPKARNGGVEYDTDEVAFVHCLIGSQLNCTRKKP